jgi:hypothetical protein
MAFGECSGYPSDWGEEPISDSWDHYDGLLSADPYSDNCNYYITESS